MGQVKKERDNTKVKAKTDQKQTQPHGADIIRQMAQHVATLYDVPVFPLRNKIPVKGFTNYGTRATKDISHPSVAEFWQTPNINGYGIVIKDITVLDIDSQLGVDFFMPLLPKTLLVQTRKGVHAYFKGTSDAYSHQQPFKTTDGPLIKIDVLSKGANNYVVGPGSYNPADLGHIYEVLNPNKDGSLPSLADITDFPDLRQHAQDYIEYYKEHADELPPSEYFEGFSDDDKEYFRTIVDKALDPNDEYIIPKGFRHNAAVSYAGRLASDLTLTDEAAESALNHFVNKCMVQPEDDEYEINIDRTLLSFRNNDLYKARYGYSSDTTARSVHKVFTETETEGIHTGIFEKQLDVIGFELNFDSRSGMPIYRAKSDNAHPFDWRPYGKATRAMFRDMITQQCLWGSFEKPVPAKWSIADLAETSDAYLEVSHGTNPWAEYLNQLIWDGVPRLENWLHECFEITDEESRLAHFAAKAMFVQSVVLNTLPYEHINRKVDYIVILSGLQGCGKSTAIQHLVPPEIRAAAVLPNYEFNDSSKEKSIATVGRVLAEGKELNGITYVGIDKLKADIDQPNHDYRPLYGSNREQLPKSHVLIGSTNVVSPIPPDAHGEARRFVLIHVGKKNGGYYHIVKYLEDNRTQLWAEAVHLVKSDTFYAALDGEIEQEHKKVTKPYVDVDPDVEEVVSEIIKEGRWFAINRFEQPIMCNICGNHKYLRMRNTRADTKRLINNRRFGEYMRYLGWTKHKDHGWLHPCPGEHDPNFRLIPASELTGLSIDDDVNDFMKNAAAGHFDFS